MNMALFSKTLLNKGNCVVFKSPSALCFTNSWRNKSDDFGNSPCNLPPTGNEPNEPTMYDARKYGHCLPSSDIWPNFETFDEIPSGVFRCTTGEVLGCTYCGAQKGGWYQNPEYFSFHHMTFYDFHLYLRKYRKPSVDSQRKPP